MMRLILARHGNTFRPEETPVWVGARTDLPLVEKGIAQAHTLGSALRRARIVPDLILTGPLQRTRETAHIVADILNLSPITTKIDERLTEIDYGLWEGLTAAEIEAKGGGDELNAWNKKSVFPMTPGWSPSETTLLANARAILAAMKAPTTLVVTSNGVLRFFARAAMNGEIIGDVKVSTGHICVMEQTADGWNIIHWNQPPEILQK